LITGYAEALRADEISGIPVLSKPFKGSELSKRVTEILAG